MRVVITGGPSSEPIDEVRVLTNTSTGELAVNLYDRFIDAGHEVDLFLGEGARYGRAAARYFDRNETLARMLAGIAGAHGVNLVLHAAALADFSVTPVDAAGAPLAAAKISSRAEGVRLLLVPKPKIISELRKFFSNAYLVGWKLEHDGDRATLIEAARQQVCANRLNACVVNGRAYGPGLGFCTEGGLVHGVPDKAAFADFMVSFAARRFQT
jgi:phosphopantothenoylcysteine synthetase/decarboxylase